jgi:Sap, sulfolipid-1-addressing protein
MGDAVGGSIGYALGIAVSPIPIAALILVLLSTRPRSGSAAFTVGWVVGIGSVATIAVVTPLFDAGEDPSDRRGWFRLIVGIVLLVAAARRWITRPGRDVEPTVPPLMRAVDGVGRFGVLGIGFALAAFNPKDMLLAAAGGGEIASADLAPGATTVALIFFTAVAASTAIAPVGAYLIAGQRLDGHLERARTWLIRHNPVVMAIVLLAVGVLFVAEGIHILRS